MIVDNEVSISVIKKEIAECLHGSYGWSFSEVDETNLTFQVQMEAKDAEIYILEIKFDNYKHWPLLVDFVDPISKAVGVKTAYPYCTDNFFNKDKIVICHPCSRKAYAGYSSIHADWGDPSSWRANKSIGLLTSLKPILLAIYCRITGDNYDGRMEKRSA